jgi:hypothetical protein
MCISLVYVVEFSTCCFPLPQRLREHASVLRYTYIACLFPFELDGKEGETTFSVR